jgi:hypothetical protein
LAEFVDEEWIQVTKPTADIEDATTTKGSNLRQFLKTKELSFGTQLDRLG